MKLSTRELMLAWATGFVALSVVTFLAVEPRVRTWRQNRERRAELDRHIEVERRLVAQAPQWAERLDRRLAALPQYPPETDVTADLLITLERLAREHGLNLTRREAQREEPQGDLWRLAIVCRWEGPLDAIVHFLFALQAESANLSVSQLSITPESSGILRGGFTVDGAYTRGSAAEPPPPEAGAPETAEE